MDEGVTAREVERGFDLEQLDADLGRTTVQAPGDRRAGAPGEPGTAEQAGRARRPHQPLLTVADLAVLAGLGPLFALSWLVPEARWPGLCRALGGVAAPLLAADPAAVAGAIERTWPDPRTRPPLSALAGWQILTILQLLRGYRPGGWHPEIRFVGDEHIRAARAEGRGAVLWNSFTVFGDLVAKMALHRAGYAVSHLSRASHGFSDSRFGVRWLNRIHTAVEDCYLGERVMLTADDGGKGALDTLGARLRANGVVNFTVHRDARRPLRMPFLNGQIVLAPGAPVLAHKTGAALLPVFAFRDDAGVLTVTVEKPLELAGGAPREAVLAGAAAQYVERLAPWVDRYPDQWRGWLHL